MSNETLIGPSTILLYGRLLEDLAFQYVPPPERRRPGGPIPRYSANRFLEEQLAVDDESGLANFARIYGFAYEGRYYDLSRPTIYLVHGSGDDPEAPAPTELYPDRRYSRNPSDAHVTGVATQSYAFSSDMKVWAYDKSDFSVRMSVDTGSLEEILLVAELSDDDVWDSPQGINARGINARGINARGINARGINARGPKKGD